MKRGIKEFQLLFLREKGYEPLIIEDVDGFDGDFYSEEYVEFWRKN